MADQKEILESIRDIISGQTNGAEPADNEILELTQMVNADGSVTEIMPAKAPEPRKIKAEEPQPEPITTQPIVEKPVADIDILSEIDSILNEKPKSPKVDDYNVELEFSVKKEEISEVLAPATNEEIREEAIDLATKPEGFEPPIVAVEEPTEKESKMENNDSLISDESAEAAKASISGLMAKLKTEGKEANKVEPLAPFRSGATVEDLVVEMLKPMMKDWLDKNLPKLVNEIVSKEIQKLIPKD